MKKIITACLFWALFGTGILNAQAILSVIPGSVKVSPATFAIGEKVSIGLVIKNTGTSKFTDPTIVLYYKTSAHNTFSILTTLNDTNGIIINPGNSIAVNNILLITDSIYFPPADTTHNIIVVWPTGIGATGKPDLNVKFTIDSTPVKYIDTSGRITTALFIPTNKNSGDMIKIYPNPAMNEFNIECTDKNTIVKAIQIIDIAGKQMTDWSFSGTQVNFTAMPNGVYLISLILSDGNKARYKVIKE